MLPSLTKQNMRYRGPMESEKLNRFAAAQTFDAIQIGRRLAEIARKITRLETAIYEGDSYEETLGIRTMSEEINKLSDQVKDMKEVIQ